MTRHRSGDPVPVPGRAALIAERQALVARLQEIDRMLGNTREHAVITPPEHR